MQVLNKALAGEEIANFEFVLRTRQGQLLEILLNATPRQPAALHSVGVLWSLHTATVFGWTETATNRWLVAGGMPVAGSSA